MTSRTIVYVDDEPALCRLFRLSTDKEEGWEVSTFTLPEEALAYVQNNKVDVLLLDYRMPAMTGLQLIEQLGTAAPDCVMISGDHGLDKSALNPHVKAVIRKPFGYDELLRIVHKLLDE